MKPAGTDQQAKRPSAAQRWTATRLGHGRALLARLPRPLVSALRVVTRSIAQFVAHDVLTLAAAMAFYTGLALAPLLMLVLWAASLLGPDLQDNLIDEIVTLVGPHGGTAVSSLIEAVADEEADRRTVGLIGGAVLLFSSSGVFAQLQGSLNLIWGVQANVNRAVWLWVRKRLLSFGMLMTVGFLLLVSLLLSAIVTMIAHRLGSGMIETTFNLAAPFLLYVGIFGAIFMWLPDVKLSIGDVWLGALLTAGLFTLGKWAIGLYLALGTIGSAYGAAGSLVVFLSWTYYSCAVLFLGAVLTHQIATERRGGVLQAEKHADAADLAQKERAIDNVSATITPHDSPSR